MTVASDTAVERPTTSPRPSLLRAESRRFIHRHFIQILLAGVLVGSATAAIIMSFQFAKTTPELLAQAKQQQEAAVAEQNGYRADCVKMLAPTANAEEACGPLATVNDYGDVTNFLPKHPYVFATGMPDLAVGVGAVVACIAFLVGATWVGAEWSSKSMVALLFWEPRRVRVIAAKLGTLVAAMAVLAAVVQLSWTAVGRLLGSARGTTGVPVDFWGELLATQGRIVLLVVLAALAGFALANLVRNTGAALGIAFVVLAMVESAVRALEPSWQQWLFTDNAMALVLPQGYTIRYLQDTSFNGEPTEIFLSHWHGGLFLGGTVGVALILGTWLFRRRDLT
jgi:ABC-type transport system involved in multi-copper enzyme maturation permease subunit